jgi:hypothetical protein
VHAALQLAEERKAREVLVVDAAHLEDVVRADLDAIALALAAAAIDFDAPSTGRCPALLAGPRRMLRRPPGLLGVELVGPSSNDTRLRVVGARRSVK